MTDQQVLIDYVLECNNCSDKKKIDKLLEYDCSLYTNLGTESTKTEKLAVRRESRKIYRAIKTLDDKLGQQLLQTIDK